MHDFAIRQLAAAVTLQAVRDFFCSTHEGKMAILKDLRSAWMRELTGGTSVYVAEQLEKNPKSIRARLRKNENEEELA